MHVELHFSFDLNGVERATPVHAAVFSSHRRQDQRITAVRQVRVRLLQWKVLCKFAQQHWFTDLFSTDQRLHIMCKQIQTWNEFRRPFISYINVAKKSFNPLNGKQMLVRGSR